MNECESCGIATDIRLVHHHTPGHILDAMGVGTSATSSEPWEPLFCPNCGAETSASEDAREAIARGRRAEAPAA